MNNRLFLKACNSVNYQTYNNIKNTLLISSSVVGLSNIGLSLCGVNNVYIGSITSLLYLSYMFLDVTDGQNYTRDINEVRSLYNEFIKNYNMMNKLFLFNDPVSIQTMFVFLLNSGYLSKDKRFSSVSKDCNDLNTLLGADVICGNGVCRHISSLLTDILNDYGISSFNAICYLPNYDFNVVNVDIANYSREKNIAIISKCLLSFDEKEMLINNLICLEENGIYLSVEYCLKKEDKKLKKFGNHLITYSLYDNKSYYLDPMMNKIYRLKDIEKYIISDGNNDIFLKINKFHSLNDLSNREIKDYIKKMKIYQDNVSVSEENAITMSTLDRCKDNLDVFEKFYNDNHELYSEISNKLVKVKKRG